MRLPRVQFTVRRMMIVVILFALAFFTEISRHINPRSHPGQLSPIHRLPRGSRRRSSRSVVASTKSVRVWAGFAAATGHRGTRSSKWPSSSTSILNGSIARSPKAESKSPKIQDTDVTCFRAQRPPWLA